jgi:hypothetical protein
MFQFLAYTPWWLIAFLALAGTILLTYGNQRNNIRIRSTGLIIVSVAILLLAGIFLVDTDAERATRHTEQIVEACDHKDWTKLASLLDANTHISLAGNELPGKVADCTGPQAIAQAAQIAANAVGLKSVGIVSKRVEQTDGLISITFTAAAVADQTLDRPTASGWEFDYRPVNKKWTLTDIKLLNEGVASL